MTRAHWIKQLEEAERELDVATKPSEIRAAARKRRIAMEELTKLDAEEKRQPKKD